MISKKFFLFKNLCTYKILCPQIAYKNIKKYVSPKSAFENCYLSGLRVELFIIFSRLFNYNYVLSDDFVPIIAIKFSINKEIKLKIAHNGKVSIILIRFKIF